MQDMETPKNHKEHYGTILAKQWKDIARFLVKRDKDAYIQIVEAKFGQLILSVLSDYLHMNRTYEDKEIKFTIHISFDNMGTVLKYIGKSQLLQKMFYKGEVQADKTYAHGSSLSWDYSSKELKTVLNGVEVVGLKVEMDFVAERVVVVIDWEMMKRILPDVSEQFGLILAMTTLSSIDINQDT
jgi:hypothetical protein